MSTTRIAYDANGNQTSVVKSLGSLPLNYRFDAANRLVAVTGGRTASVFVYDGDGDRISQSVGNGTYNYLNDVASALPVVLQESGPDGDISYAYGLGLISESSSKFYYFYHYDGLGSVIALSDATGKPSAAYLYDPWGNPLVSVPDSVGTKNKFRFTGEALDRGTRRYYLRARYYDSSVGRFGSRDPFEGLTRNPQTENRYAYAAANPLRYRDPSGFMFTALIKFFVDLGLVAAGPATDAANANDATAQSGCTGLPRTNIENCTPAVQHQQQEKQIEAINAVRGDLSQDAIGVATDTGSWLQSLNGLPGEVAWVWNKLKSAFTPATAAAPQSDPAANPGARVDSFQVTRAAQPLLPDLGPPMSPLTVVVSNPK